MEQASKRSASVRTTIAEAIDDSTRHALAALFSEDRTATDSGRPRKQLKPKKQKRLSRPLARPAMTAEERRDRYDRWVYLLHLERPNFAELSELARLQRMFRRSSSDQPKKEVKDRPLPFGREVQGGSPGLGRRR